MKFKISITVHVCALLICTQALAQNMLDTAVRGSINLMHSNFVSSGFSAGLAGTGAHPKDLIKNYDSFKSSVEKGRSEVSAVLNDIEQSVDRILMECGQPKNYSSCNDKSCRKSALEQLQKCGVSKGQYNEMSSRISQIQELHEKLNSEKVNFSIQMKAHSVSQRALGIEMAAALVVTGQTLFFPLISPYDPQDKLTSKQEREIIIAGVKSAWERIGELLGCHSGEIDAEFAIFKNTPNFIETVCQLSEVGMKKGSVLAEDLIAIYEPHVNWEIYTNFKK